MKTVQDINALISVLSSSISAAPADSENVGDYLSTIQQNMRQIVSILQAITSQL